MVSYAAVVIALAVVASVVNGAPPPAMTTDEFLADAYARQKWMKEHKRGWVNAQATPNAMDAGVAKVTSPTDSGEKVTTPRVLKDIKCPTTSGVCIMEWDT
jgi:hypothetical protein